MLARCMERVCYDTCVVGKANELVLRNGVRPAPPSVAASIDLLMVVCGL